MDYQPTEDTLDSAAEKIRYGSISSFTLDIEVADIRYALVSRPNIDRGRLSLWVGTVEYLGEQYARIWDLLLKVDGLRFVSLGFEESVSLEDRHMSVEMFPWDDWFLVVGALRSSATPASGPWTIRTGPAFHRERNMGWTSDMFMHPSNK